jgi:hypothetical protein
MTQNYPLYEVIHGTTLPSLGSTVEVFVVMQGSNGKPTVWSAAPPDPANLATTQSNGNIPGHVYVVGSGAGNGTYSSSAAAKTAALAYCNGLVAARDQTVTVNTYKTGDASGALSLNADSPVLGPL